MYTPKRSLTASGTDVKKVAQNISPTSKPRASGHDGGSHSNDFMSTNWSLLIFPELTIFHNVAFICIFDAVISLEVKVKCLDKANF